MVIVSCFLLLLAAGSKRDKEPESFASDMLRPTWTATQTGDMTSSMTAVVKVNFAAQYPDKAADFVNKNDDLLAAFIRNDCVGVAYP